MPQINDQSKIQIMHETAQLLSQMIRERQSNRLKLLDSLTSFSIENVPDEVKVSREKEAAVLRAVIQEQDDIQAVIKMLFPPPKQVHVRKKVKKSRTDEGEKK